MLNFTRKGLLSRYKENPSNLSEIISIFVEKMASSERKILFGAYLT